MHTSAACRPPSASQGVRLRQFPFLELIMVYVFISQSQGYCFEPQFPEGHSKGNGQVAWSGHSIDHHCVIIHHHRVQFLMVNMIWAVRHRDNAPRPPSSGKPPPAHDAFHSSRVHHRSMPLIPRGLVWPQLLNPASGTRSVSSILAP